VRVIDIDAIAHNMVALDDDVAEIDADAVKHAPILRQVRVPLGHQLSRHVGKEYRR